MGWIQDVQGLDERTRRCETTEYAGYDRTTPSDRLSNAAVSPVEAGRNHRLLERTGRLRSSSGPNVPVLVLERGALESERPFRSAGRLAG